MKYFNSEHMDNQGTSLFQSGEIHLNQSCNEEEQEDLEDQKRRKEELQALLTKLDDFNYDESTVNSSIVSAISCNDNVNYLQTTNPNEQLQILYEVKVRELQALKEKNEGLSKEIDSYRKKLLLTEAEMEQIKVSYRNSDELLVEKTSEVKELTAALENKDKKIQDYEKSIQDMHLEILTHKSTINDLHLQMQSDRNPFNQYNKQFTSEEYKNANKEQISRLDVVLEEKTKSVKILEKENMTLKEELKKLIVSNNESTNMIEILTRNFDGAQKQSMELISDLEALSNENRHLNERITNMYQNSPSNNRLSLDRNSLMQQLEKLKKMLVDKSVHIDTLNVKLKHYDDNIKELLEYRQLKADVYKKEFQQCDNKDHTKCLVVMQNELQNYRRIIEDKDQQIHHLNCINKDNLAKMEGAIFQTRNDINNLSNKYSMPQLEKMAEDLKDRNDKIAYLEQELKNKTDELVHQECNKEKELKSELEQLKLLTDKERNNFENEIKKLAHEVEIATAELKNLKTFNEEILNENVKLKSRCKEEDSALKNEYLESMKALQEAKSNILSLQEKIDELTNLKTIAEGENCTFQSKLKEYQKKLEDSEKDVEELEMDLENALKQLKEKEETIKNLKQADKMFKQEIKSKMDKNLDGAIKEIKNKEDIINKLQQAISTISEELDVVKTAKENDVNRIVTIEECRKCKKNQEIMENEIPVKDKNTVSDVKMHEIGEENLQKMKEAEMIALEVKLREEIQEEFFTKLKEVESKYQQVCASSKALSKEKADKLKAQELKFREDLATVLGGCTKKIKEYEQDREEIIKEYQDLRNQYEEYKRLSTNKERNFEKAIEKMQLNSKQEAEKWRRWSQRLINSCVKIEATNKKTRDHVLFQMGTYDTQVAVIEKSYEKVKDLLTKEKNC